MTENRGDTSCPQRDSAEREGYAEVPRTFRTLWKERGDAAPDLLERMLDRNNLNRAYKRVKANKGAPGIDGMTVDEALPYLRENRDAIIGNVLRGKYTPCPVKRVEIPKPDGGVRLLGIPTVKDRILQQAFTQKLVPIYEPLFADGSYGCRPGRSCQDAIRKVAEYANEGYTQAVVLDLSKYFDTLNHNLPLNLLRRQIDDERVIQIIKRWLKSGVMTNGVVMETGEGSPQGGVISPLLANIYLNEFDQEYTRRGVRFVRYADDIVLFAKSRRAAQRLLEGAVRFLTQTLKLKVNEEKSRITSVYSLRFQYLGFTLGAARNGAQIRIHPKKKQKIKRELKQLTKRSKGLSVRVIMQLVEQKMRGWLQYYSLACMKGFIADLAEWLRHRYRMIIWKQWKRIKTKMRNLRKLGIDKEKARQAANTSHGPFWATSHSTVNFAITNKRLEAAGCYDIEAAYNQMHSSY